MSLWMWSALQRCSKDAVQRIWRTVFARRHLIRTEPVDQWITRVPGLDAQGNPLKSLYQEAEEASDCPVKRKRILGVCWDRCPNDYKAMGAICEPPGGPKLVVPQWDRDYCGPSSFQPSRCAVIYAKDVNATVAEIRARGNNDLADRVEANGLEDPALVKEVEGVLECPKRRKLIAGVCWDQCPKEVIPSNADEVVQLRDAFTQAEKNYEDKREEVNKAYAKYEEEYLGGVETWEESKADYKRLQEEEKVMIELMKEAEAKWIPAKKEYTRNRRTGYKDIGALCEPLGYTDAVTGNKIKAGPSVVADLFRRYECPRWMEKYRGCLLGTVSRRLPRRRCPLQQECHQGRRYEHGEVTWFLNKMYVNNKLCPLSRKV